MLTYADVCWRVLACAVAGGSSGFPGAILSLSKSPSCPQTYPAYVDSWRGSSRSHRTPSTLLTVMCETARKQLLLNVCSDVFATWVAGTGQAQGEPATHIHRRLSHRQVPIFSFSSCGFARVRACSCSCVCSCVRARACVCACLCRGGGVMVIQGTFRCVQYLLMARLILSQLTHQKKYGASSCITVL